ncbi:MULTISPECIES: hypothetical protein [unclassified Microcoleus]|uniref:hypothetical protein n=1 Tax=unclassified Microcoleus TaxID=2642155 RepID=UPI002FD0849A
MLAADLQRQRSRYFDSWLSYFDLDRRHNRGLVNAGNRLYCKKVKHLICDNNSPRDRKRGLHKDLGREEQIDRPSSILTCTPGLEAAEISPES